MNLWNLICLCREGKDFRYLIIYTRILDKRFCMAHSLGIWRVLKGPHNGRFYRGNFHKNNDVILGRDFTGDPDWVSRSKSIVLIISLVCSRSSLLWVASCCCPHFSSLVSILSPRHSPPFVLNTRAQSDVTSLTHAQWSAICRRYVWGIKADITRDKESIKIFLTRHETLTSGCVQGRMGNKRFASRVTLTLYTPRRACNWCKIII